MFDLRAISGGLRPRNSVLEWVEDESRGLQQVLTYEQAVMIVSAGCDVKVVGYIGSRV